MPSLAAPRPIVSFDYPKLRSWRETAGKSREQVCTGVGISYSLLNAFEIGRLTPRVAVLIKLAEFFGHDPGELLVGSNGVR